MSNKDFIKLALELADINGISSREEEVATYVRKQLSHLKDIKVERDNLGSIAFIKKGKAKDAPTISITAHMDEVGFMVTRIEKNGFIKFAPIGGWWGHVLLGQRLTITSSNGKEYTGVVGSTPPHILTEAQRSSVLSIDKMYIDLGTTSDKEVKDIGIKPGCMVTPTSQAFVGLDGDALIGKAFDDRISIAVGIEVLKRLEKVNHEANVILVCSTQEEVGLRGAKTSAYKWTPDVAFAVDVTIAYDMPGMEEKETKLRTGVALSLFDRSVIGNNNLVQMTEAVAKKHKIKYTFDSLPLGGTDAGTIHLTKDGVITMTLSIPSRYIHSHNSMVTVQDSLATVDLLVNFVKEFNSKKLEELKYK